MSDFGKLNWADLGKGVLIAFLTAFLGSLYTVLDSGSIPTLSQAGQWALGGAAAGVSYVLKNLFTNSNNELAKPEPK